MLNKNLICTCQNENSYEIQIEEGCLDKNFIANILAIDGIESHLTFAIISDETVKPLYADKIASYFVQANLRCVQFSFKNGEENKTRRTKEHLEDQMLQANLGSDTCLIAIGGGVTTDLVGFIAATYCRAIPLILIPTTLLAMCDAALGGKNGVNTPFGKNLIGTIKQPEKVIIDPKTLKTLKEKELKEGVSEVIKHAIIADALLFEFLKNISNPFAIDVLNKIIFESCRIKLEIVKDENKNKRHLLNFGHTVAHAIEMVSHHKISHGEAVAIGMLIESHIAMQLGILQRPAFDNIKKILLRFGFNLHLAKDLPIEKLITTMILDKKSIGATPRFVILEDIGACLECSGNYCMPVNNELIRKAFVDLSIV